MRWKTVSLVVVVAAAGALATARLVRGSRGKDAQYQTRSVDRGDVIETITATGTLQALVQVDVGTQVSGTLSELDCDFNSVVKKGQVLARIDPALFRAAVEQADANLTAARAAVLKAQANEENDAHVLARDLALAKQELVAPQDVDTARAAEDAAKADVETARAAVEQAQAALDTAQLNLQHAVIYAPVSGTVIARDVQVGQTVAASFASPTLFTIAEDLTRMEVDANIAEADVGKLQAGQPVRFTVDAYPGEPFNARLTEVRNQPITVQNVVTYVAVIDVDNPQLKLKPGMTANVSVVIGEAKGALRVPNAALRFRPPSDDQGAESKGGEGGGHGGGSTAGGGWSGGGASGGGAHHGARAVYVLRDGRAERHEVKTGLTDGSYTELRDDALAEGEPVIVDLALPDGAGGGGSHRGPTFFH